MDGREEGMLKIQPYYVLSRVLDIQNTIGGWLEVQVTHARQCHAFSTLAVKFRFLPRRSDI